MLLEELSYMHIVSSLEDIPPLSSPIALSIGTFDGVHIGHQYLLSFLHAQGSSVVITFDPHPLEVLKEEKIVLLCSLQERLERIKNEGIDVACVLPFDKKLANQEYKDFLFSIRQYVPFDILVLGEGARFGREGKGTKEAIELVAKESNFTVLYLPKVEKEGKIVSSRLIRELVSQKAEDQVARLLNKKG